MDNNTPILNEDCNELLLKAIQKKFAAQNAGESVSFRPTAFKIPTLQPSMAGSSGSQPTSSFANPTSSCSGVSSQLKEFIMGHLNEKGRYLEKNESRFIIPVLKSGTGMETNSNLVVVSKDFENLKIADNRPLEPAIDLTVALTSSHNTEVKAEVTALSSRMKAKARMKASAENHFDIPFIECDRHKKTPASSNADDEYTLPYAPTMNIKDVMVRPSPFGQIICLNQNYVHSLKPIKRASESKFKYKIKPFKFDTPSPDDKILATLNKCQHRHHQ